MILDIAPKFYSTLSLPYNLQVKVTDRNLMLKFYLKVLKIFYLLSYFSNHTQTNYDHNFKVIVLIFYLIDKREFRRAILSGDRSCFFDLWPFENFSILTL